jgi:bisphosphoglycerate-dependent phosphoglycerate mutase
MESRYDTLKKQHEQGNKLELFNKYIDNLKNLVLRQTDYTEDIAHKKLIEYDLDVMKILREYMNISKVPVTDNKSTNQRMYGEFRKFLDDASKSHYKQKEFEELRQKYIQHVLANKDNSNNTIV